jgi:hypothetical protein
MLLIRSGATGLFVGLKSSSEIRVHVEAVRVLADALGTEAFAREAFMQEMLIGRIARVLLDKPAPDLKEIHAWYI